MTDSDVHVRTVAPDPLSPLTDAFAFSADGPVSPVLFNGDFAVPPADIEAPLDNLDNRLEGWTYVNADGNFAAYWVNPDSTRWTGVYEQNPVIVFEATAAVATNEAYFEQVVRAVGNAAAREYHIASYDSESAISVSTYVTARYMEADGTTVGTVGTGIEGAEDALPNTTGVISATATGVRIRFGVTQDDAGPDTGEVCAIYGVYHDRMASRLYPVPSFSGIKFPATQVPSADANTLDDYEEGTWTPSITFTTPGNLVVVASSAVGRYTKVGRMVHCEARFTTSTFTHTTASGTLVLTGLPFTVLNALQGCGGVAMAGWTSAAVEWLNIRPILNTATCDLLVSLTAAAVATLQASQMPTGGTVNIFCQFSYVVV